MMRFGLARQSAQAASRADVVTLLARLGSLLAHELRPADALTAIARGADGPGRLARRIARTVARGTSLSTSLARYAPCLAAHELAALRAGEASGCLAESIAFLANWQQSQATQRSNVRAAVAYPIALVATAGGALAFLALAVVPSFAELYSDADSSLPAPAALLMKLGTLLENWSAIVACSVLGLGAALALVRKTSGRARQKSDATLLRLPVVGSFIQATTKARATSLVTLLLRAGCELEAAIALAAPTASNRVLRARLDSVRAALRRGRLLSAAWVGAGLDESGTETILLDLAEQAGGYEAALARIASLNEERCEAALARLKHVAEPAAVIIAALVVGLGATAVYAPLLNSTSALAGGVS
ncbi:MAG: type IV pilus assembly protein PilC [Hyphomicrobiaceae bacterium]|jgi:type IV pilus assembly protein PilC